MAKNVSNQLVPNMSTCIVTDEIPAGLLNYSNVTFTLNNVPANGTVDIFVNNQKLQPITDYTLSGKVITLLDPPHPSDTIYCNYHC